MRARPSRTISVTASATNIRKQPATPGTTDPNALPVTFAKLRYASGGATIQLVPLSTSVYGDGEDITADEDYIDTDQQINRYVVASGAGPTSLVVTDFEA